MSRRFSLAGLITLSLLVAASLAVSAQRDERPAITVVPFDLGPGVRHSRDAGETLADTLAARLESSGRYRVLLCGWLPIPAGTKGPAPLSTLRSAATEAGVDYVVTGAIGKTTRRIVSRPAALPLPPGPFGGFAVIRPRLYAPGPLVIHRTVTTLDIQVIDARSGDVAERATAASDAGETPALADITNSLTRLAARLARHDR